MEMLERLKILMESRKELANLRTQKEVSYAQWIIDNDLLLRQIEGAAMTVAVNEGQIKADAEAGYAQDFSENPNKHPFPGVDIKEFTELRYESKQALAWAMEHRIALSLDKKAFEFIAKQGTPGTEFVEIVIVPRAQIAQDLEKALPKEIK